jgi:hypothetical protein
MSHLRFHINVAFTETCMAYSLRQAYDYYLQVQPGNRQCDAISLQGPPEYSSPPRCYEGKPVCRVEDCPVFFSVSRPPDVSNERS